MSADEIWKPVVGWEAVYEISATGLCRNRRSGRLLKASPNNRGYREVNLCGGGIKKTVSIHALVATAFLGERPYGYAVNHIDGDKLNNVVSNLEYVTPRENTLHAIRTGLNTWHLDQPKGADAYMAKLTWADVEAIRKAVAGGVPRKRLQRKYKLSKGHLSQIINYKIYKNPPR